MKKIGLVTLLLCMILPQIVLAASVRAEYKISSFRYSIAEKTETQPQAIRIEIGLNKPSESFALHVDPENPKRLILDLERTKLGRVKKQIDLDGDLAKAVEFVKVDNANSRAGIVLSQDASELDYKVSTLPPDKTAKQPFRIVVEISEVVKSKQGGDLRGRTIVIDPGHGGSDSGAVGPRRVKEKSVTLGVSLKLEQLLLNAGANVVMTRRDDRDVFGPNATDGEELSARVAVGKRQPADLFLSIHANSFTKPTAHGTATYYYEKTPADVALASALQNGLVQSGGRYNRGIVEANFYVVKRSRMPAALVELAFISNPEEERLLASSSYQEALAEGLLKGLADYFSEAAQ